MYYHAASNTISSQLVIICHKQQFAKQSTKLTINLTMTDSSDEGHKSDSSGEPPLIDPVSPKDDNVMGKPDKDADKVANEQVHKDPSKDNEENGQQGNPTTDDKAKSDGNQDEQFEDESE